MDELLTGLRAAAEPTRLRLLMLCAQGELTVSELTEILGPEPAARLPASEAALRCRAARPFPRGHLGVLPPGAARAGRASWRGSRPARAAGRRHRGARPRAPRGDQAPARRRRPPPISAPTPRNGTASARSMSTRARSRRRCTKLLPAQGDRATCSISAPAPGACSRSSAPRVERAVGVDLSREMLAVARVNLERAELRNCSLRQGDMYQLPLPGAVVRCRRHPSGAALRRAPGPGHRRGGARAASRRPAGDRRFRAARSRVPARRACPSPAGLRRRRGARTGAAPPGSILDGAAPARRPADRVALAGARARADGAARR